MERTKRQLTAAEEALVEEFWKSKADYTHRYGYVTTTMPVPMGGVGSGGPWTNPDRIIPAGQTLKIVMLSRFGDFGLTDDLSAENGYHVRLDIDDAAITDIRRDPAPPVHEQTTFA